VRYERPAIDRRVKVTDPVVKVVTVSPTVPTPAWAPHEANGAPGDAGPEAL
jgi:hypothetical protein